MVVPTFRPRGAKSNFQQKTRNPALIYVLAIAVAGLLIYFGSTVFGKGGGLIGGKSGLIVEVQNTEAEVYVDGNLLGRTPFQSDSVKAGDHRVSIRGADSSYEAQLSFAKGSQVALVRDLGVSEAFSAGTNLWLEKSSSTAVLSVVSEPSGAKVFINNTQLGTTPFSTSTISDGEYDLRLDAPGFETLSTRIQIQKGHKLNVTADLFPIPAPSRVELLADSTSLYDVNSSEIAVTANSTDWARAVVYWNKTRGVALGEGGVTKEPVFDYFIDFNGRIYDRDGVDVTSAPDGIGTAVRGAYLRRVSDGAGITPAAQTALASLSSALGKRVQISGTPEGWLNVRASASTTADILQRVNEGEVYPVLEEAVGWVKIKVSETVEGWVSSTYARTVE